MVGPCCLVQDLSVSLQEVQQQSEVQKELLALRACEAPRWSVWVEVAPSVVGSDAQKHPQQSDWVCSVQLAEAGSSLDEFAVE